MGRRLMGLALVATLCGCAAMPGGESGKGDMMARKSLYERLGGKPAITAVVDDFVANVAADSRISFRFANANVPRLKMLLVDQVCEATGGPCKYTGKDMRAAHAGMQISDAEFNALAEDLTRSLDKFKVPDREKTELLGAIGGLRSQVVNQ